MKEKCFKDTVERCRYMAQVAKSTVMRNSFTAAANEIDQLRAALRGMLDLDEENHQRGSGDEDICAEVRAAYEALTPNVKAEAHTQSDRQVEKTKVKEN